MLLVGAAREVITPPIGTPLEGYTLERISTRVRDELTATAIAIDDGKIKALFVSVCICLIKNDIAEALKSQIKQELGIDNVIICATHTHSGPVTTAVVEFSDGEAPYCDKILIPQIVSAAKKAVAEMKEAVVGIGYTESDVGINRRFIDEEGKVKLGENPWGIIDKKMYVIAFKGTDGTPICNMIHYGCHGTAAHGSEEPFITRDWSGEMVDRLEDYTGAITAYFNAAEGDIAPRLSYSSTCRQKQMGELGSRAGHHAIMAYREIREYKSRELTVCTDEIKLPFEALPSKETAEAELAKLEAEGVWGLRLREVDQWKAVLDVHNTGNVETHLKFMQNIIAIGEIAFVPFPFEHFTEISMRLAHYSPFGYTLSLSNANGYNSYLPNQTEICRGGYEIWAFKTRGAYNMPDDTDETIIKENLKILRKMKQKKENQ